MQIPHYKLLFKLDGKIKILLKTLVGKEDC